MTILRWFDLQGTETLPIIPPGATLKEGSTVRPEHRGKVPGTRNKNKVWSGMGGKWSNDFQMTEARAKQADAWGAGVGIQGRIFPGLDIDVNDAQLADAIERLAFECIGPAPVRYREGSARRLLMYRIADGEAPFRKRRIAWEGAQAVELLGLGQYYNVEGEHPKGGQYLWRNGHPCELGADHIPEITKAKADAFFAGLGDLLDCYGYELKGSGDNATTGKNRKPLTDKTLHAPTPELVVSVLNSIPCTEESFNNRDAFVSFLASLKASLGPAADEHWPAVLDWALNYPGAEESFIAKIWNSINDAELGWEWLAGWARGHGWHEDAQADFDDDTTNAGKDPSVNIPETDFDRMISRFAYVKDLGQYNDMEDGSFLSGKDFNAVNVLVKPFGSSGQQSAEAVFQNAKDAKKVVTATSRPGEPVITKAPNGRGQPVDAVNLWRASNIERNHNATTADVASWLDLVTQLFGPETSPECKHFLDWWAFVLQHPGEKIGHALVIIGGQGVGKDTVLKPLFEAVGLHNVASIDTGTLLGQWTYFLKSQIVYCQEMIGRRDLYNMLKPFISAQATRLAVNEKGLRQYFVPNNQNWIVTSNHNNAISLEDDDRRFWVHRALLEEPPEGDYFARLHKWFKAGGTANVFGWLMNRDVRGFNPMAPPPITAAKRAMVDQSQPAPVRWLRDLLSDAGLFSDRTVMTIDELCKAADKDWSAPHNIDHKSAMAALRGTQFKAAHRVRLKDGMRQLWARGLPGTVTADEMRNRYLAEFGNQCREAV